MRQRDIIWNERFAARPFDTDTLVLEVAHEKYDVTDDVERAIRDRTNDRRRGR